MCVKAVAVLQVPVESSSPVKSLLRLKSHCSIEGSYTWCLTSWNRPELNHDCLPLQVNATATQMKIALHPTSLPSGHLHKPGKTVPTGDSNTSTDMLYPCTAASGPLTSCTFCGSVCTDSMLPYLQMPVFCKCSGQLLLHGSCTHGDNQCECVRALTCGTRCSPRQLL